MIVRVDLATVPPTIEVLQQEDFAALKAVLVVPEHTWIDQRVMRPREGYAVSTEFAEKFAAMVAYADTRGWTDTGGRLQAHVELVIAQPDGSEQES